MAMSRMAVPLPSTVQLLLCNATPVNETRAGMLMDTRAGRYINQLSYCDMTIHTVPPTEYRDLPEMTTEYD